MNNNYIVLKKYLSKGGNKKIATGFAFMGFAISVLAMSFTGVLFSFLTSWGQIFGLVLFFLSAKYLYDGYKSIQALRSNEILLAIERGDTSAALMIQKAPNQRKQNSTKYNITVSGKDGSKYILEPTDEDLNLVFNCLKQAFPNANTEK